MCAHIVTWDEQGFVIFVTSFFHRNVQFLHLLGSWILVPLHWSARPVGYCMNG